MITVANGSLQITLQPADPSTNHNLNYTGGMLSSWNKRVPTISLGRRIPS